MMKPVYILAATAITPQETFEGEAFLQTIHHSENNSLKVIDTDYREFISPVAIRRMSRQLKMGITCGMKALQNAQTETPDAIITGTGMGSKLDMEHFLKDMIRLEEATLNPTFFIQSTYNSVNGWLAMLSKCPHYNQTYVHRGLSMEMALMDAQLFLSEATENKVVLAGGYDELTDEYYFIKNKIGYWKNEIIESQNLYRHSNTNGTIAGEGVAFFTLTNEEIDAVQLQGLKLIQEANAETIATDITQFLDAHGLSSDDIDVVVSGENGDARFQSFYQNANALWNDSTSLLAFKHLTGEYPTASGAGLWFGNKILQEQEIPETMLRRKGAADKPFRHLLLINHYILQTASLMLLSSKYVR